MPPKNKKQRVNATILTDLQTAISSTKPSLLSPAQLPTQLLKRAYGLAPPLQGSPGGGQLNRECSNIWTGAQNGQAEAGSSKDGAGKVKSFEEDADTEIIILDSADEDFKPSTSKGKGKGKGKAKMEELQPKPCSSDNCDRNPRCLNWLGQDKWEKNAQARKDFRKASGLPIDPSNDREAELPVGLQNLGATCYANSFLQVWYRDAKFRSCVYSYLPPSNGKVEASPIFQLQVLFAFLEKSIQGVYDPSPLIKSLDIDSGEQQDAQEFSKLFLAVLDREFKKQAKRAEEEGGDGSAATLIEDHFEGKSAYRTTCQNCDTVSERPSTWNELELNLSKDCKLEDRIKEMLKGEMLEGDNQYACEQCASNQDAKRKTVLVSLPPVLHFSLIRFVWNPKELQRSKSHHAISYPLELNMGQFLPLNPATKKRDDVWYDLKGVLMHKGQSAHHGHYVAQGYDETESKWFLFDDEAVSPIDDLNAPTVHDEDGEPVKSKKRPPAGFPRDTTGAIIPKSKDAYMLVYARRDPSSSSAASTSTAQKPAVTATPPPPLAMQAVEVLDATYQAEMAEYEAKAKEIDAEFKKRREEKRSVYRVWTVEDDEDESYLVDKNELRRWLADGLKKPKGKGKKKAVEADSSEVEIVESKPDIATDEKKDAPSLEDVQMSNGDVEPTASTSASAVASTSKSPDSDDLPDPSTLHQPSPSPVPIKVISNVAIVCEHGSLNPAKADSMKRVSQAGVEALKALGVELEPEMMAPRDFCRECVGGIAAEHLYDRKHPEDIEEFTEADKDASARSAFISKEWVKDWRKLRPKMHLDGTGRDPAPDAEPFLRDIECEHGGLQPDPKKRHFITPAAIRVLKGIFPGWKPSKATTCEICEEGLKDHAADVALLGKRLVKEKTKLKSIHDMYQSKLIGNRLPLSPDTQAHFALPQKWCRVWSSWAKQTASKVDHKGLPGNVDNSPFLCKHDLLCLDLKREVEGQKSIGVVGLKEWEYLQDAYEAGPPIRIWQSVDLPGPSSWPKVCEECLDEQRSNFDTTEIQVKQLSADDFDKDGHRKRDSSPEKAPVQQYRSNKTYGSRSSSRIKEKPATMFRKQLKFINIAKGDQVKDIKRLIEHETKIPIIAQRVFHHFQELQDSSLSVADLELKSGDTLEVFGVDTDNVDLSKLEDAKPSRGSKRGRAEGFGGTGLSGWEEFPAAAMEVDGGEAGPSSANGNGSNGNGNGASSSSSVTIDAAMDGDDDRIPCPHCTFLNAAGMTTCELCDQSLAG